MIEARVICDSVSPSGQRLTTFKLRYQRFIHSEFMTHRAISRNASGSRAVPVAKLLEEVRSDALRAEPVFWGKNRPGMQSVEEFDDVTLKYVGDDGSHVTELAAARVMWRKAALRAAGEAERLMKFGFHKQLANRLLEPFSHINVVATATEWENFFGLRLHHTAQPEIRALAIAMWKARKSSYPIPLRPGEWHLPFVDAQIEDDGRQSYRERPDPQCIQFIELDVAIKASVARCARVSYESFETGKRSTVAEDLKLYDRLTAGLRDPDEPLHASPMEHQATPDEVETISIHDARPALPLRWKTPTQHGNLVGWRQYRKTLSGEALAPLPEEYRS